MKSTKVVWVEKNSQLQAVRIFKTTKAASAAARHICRRIEEMFYGEAVKEIRHQLFLRSKGFCELCGEIVLESGGHMHEQKHRGKGGEISLENSVFICPICHGLAHKDRNPHWIKSEVKYEDLRKMSKT